MTNPFEAALAQADNVIFDTFSNASIKCGDVTCRGILDFPLSVKKLKNDAGEIADCDYKLSVASSDVKSAGITKRSKLEITMGDGTELSLYVIHKPEDDGDGMSEMQLGVQSGSTTRPTVSY